jgi:hypothetical protein
MVVAPTSVASALTGKVAGLQKHSKQWCKSKQPNYPSWCKVCEWKQQCINRN